MPKKQPTPGTSQRVLIYIRVSALMGRGGDDFHSPEVQAGAVRRMISHGSMREIAVIDDDIDQTGRTFNRPGVRRIKQLVEAGHVDAVAFYDIKRFGRNVLEGLQFAKWLHEHGVVIISACENIDTSTPTGRWMLTNLLSIGELQSDEIGRYWSTVRHKRGVAGLWHGVVPLGYLRKNGTLEPHPIMGPAMERAFRAYAQGGRTGEIVNDLALAYGKPQHASTFKKQLRNRVYLGEVRVGDEHYPGRHTPIIDAETFDLVQARIATETKAPYRWREKTWCLVEIAFCPNGHPLTRYNRPDEPGGPKIERAKCGRAAGHGVAKDFRCPGIGQPRMERIEREVLRQWGERAQYLRANVREHAERAARRATKVTDTGHIDAELAKIRGAIDRLAKQWLMQDDMLDERTYRSMMADFRQSELALEKAQIEALSGPVSLDPIAAATAAEAAIALWDEMTVPEKAYILRTQVKAVVVRGPEYYREHESHRVRVRWIGDED